MISLRNGFGMQFVEKENGAILEAINTHKQVELVNVEALIWDLWVEGEFINQFVGLETAIRNAECLVPFQVKAGEVIAETIG